MRNSSNFWSIEITSNRGRFLEISEIISSEPMMERYIKLIPEAFPDLPGIESVFLASPQINSIAKTDQEAFFKLNSLYLMLNGILSLFFNDVRKSQEFDSVFKNYEPGYMGRLDANSKIKISEEIEYSFPFYNEERIQFENNKHIMLEILRLAINNKELCFILMQLGIENSWVRLYSIWDTISFNMKRSFNLLNKGEVIQFLGLRKRKDDIKCFEGCANSYGLLFIDSRHGNQGWDIPNVKMNREKATSLIKDIIRKYIDRLLQVQ